jgi:hypothetical protein
MPALNWIGKEAVVRHHMEVPFRLLEPVPELSCGNAKRGNLIYMKTNDRRFPNLIVAAQVAAVVGEKAKHIRDKGLDGQYYRDMILELVRKHQPVAREDIDRLLMDKLPEILSQEQKLNRIKNLMSQLVYEGLIRNDGSRRYSRWVLGASND